MGAHQPFRAIFYNRVKKKKNGKNVKIVCQQIYDTRASRARARTRVSIKA